MRHLVGYVAAAFVASQRYAAPVVTQVLVHGMVAAAPPLDASSAQLDAAVQLACAAWTAYLVLGTPAPGQRAVTVVRSGSAARVRVAELVVAALAAAAVPATVVALAAASGHLAPGTGTTWGVAVVAPTVTGAGLGALVRALLPRHPGYAALGVVVVTLAALVLPHVPPLAGLAAVPPAPADLVLDVVGGAVVSATAAVLGYRIERRR